MPPTHYWQATLVDFPYLREIWRENTGAERLLGVSLTGIMDNRLMSGQHGMEQLSSALKELREHSVQVGGGGPDVVEQVLTGGDENLKAKDRRWLRMVSRSVPAAGVLCYAFLNGSVLKGRGHNALLWLECCSMP